MAQTMAGRGAYNGDFSAELILDLALLESIWAFIFDNREELFDTHLGGDVGLLSR